jgi:hypothetical protein
MAIKIQGDVVIYDNKVFKLGSGTTAQRPTAETGMIWFNTDLGVFEGYNGVEWSAVGSPDADTAIKLATARTIALSGDVTGSASFDGSANVTISATVADDSHNHSLSSGNFTVGGNLIANGDITSAGSLTAISKSFEIDHPTKSGMRLRYGCLEGPENGVYVRGRLTGNVIVLPDYWTGLVCENSITVNLTAIGQSQNLFVEGICDNCVFVSGTDVDCFYTVYAERKDVEKLEVEF